MTAWHEDPLNTRLIDQLRAALDDDGRLLVFLGSGLSFGAARVGGRARFDYEKYDRWRPFDFPPVDHWPDDDGLPMPSWPMLVSRMCRDVALHTPPEEHESLRKFFIEQGPLDCAQLFRQTVGEANYREFLLAQFDSGRHHFVSPTPSHSALVALGLPLVFTTNYDELIEAGYLQAGLDLRVSISEADFRGHRATKPQRHLVKLHGSIDRPETIVLTRSDYARSRVERKEMFGHLRSEMATAPFLFVGFSLSDPNFGLIHDDIRLVYGLNVPPSYTVQGRRDPVIDRYLRSIDVNTIWLDGWNRLPDFLRRLAPADRATQSGTSDRDR